MIEPETQVRRNDRATFRRLENGAGVILHLGSTQYHGVNEVGAAIWELIEPPRAFADLVEALRAQLEDPPDDLESEVAGFLDDLATRDLVALSPAGDLPGEDAPAGS